MGQSKKTPSKAATVKAAAGKHANHKPIIKATVHAKASTKSKTQAEKPVAMAVLTPIVVLAVWLAIRRIRSSMH